MANVAALKKKAADFEQKKQLDKAIAAYREVLDVFDSCEEENIDVGLYNRVGDLLVRQGNTPEAVSLYERAVDLYAEGGFFNNAIALCNKVLRTSPGRSTVYYKLGKISAAKGFKADAKQNFLEYADRMQKAGQMEEAFRALKEFADLVPDQDDVRQMLAEQLTKADKKSEALEQLQLLYARYSNDGRDAEAEATAERMRAIDPSAVPTTDGSLRAAAKNDDLIFINLDAPARKTRQTRALRAIDAPVVQPEPVASAAEFAELDLTSIPEAPAPPRNSDRDLALAGDLSLLDLSDAPLSAVSRRSLRNLDVLDDARAAAVAESDDDYVSLGDALRDEEGPKNTRMIVEAVAPSGDEAADFADMLKKFKQGVADNVAEEDYESHYDLGVAFREMGLLDEAISEFQKALRGVRYRVRTCEALGQCFLEKKQLQVAMTILQRALHEPGVGDEQLIGVLYLLGYTCEALGRPADAKPFYERVFSVDIQFLDVGDRLNAVDKAIP